MWIRPNLCALKYELHDVNVCPIGTFDYRKVSSHPKHLLQSIPPYELQLRGVWGCFEWFDGIKKGFYLLVGLFAATSYLWLFLFRTHVFSKEDVMVFGYIPTTMQYGNSGNSACQCGGFVTQTQQQPAQWPWINDDTWNTSSTPTHYTWHPSFITTQSTGDVGLCGGVIYDADL